MQTTLAAPVTEKKQATKQPFFQAKLTINEPGDVYEQEADAVADRVMRTPAPMDDTNIPFKKVSISNLQRKCAACEEEEKIQRKEIIQREEKEQTPAPSTLTLPPFRLTPPSLLSIPPSPLPTLQIDWLSINQTLHSRGALHLAPSLRGDIEQVWERNYHFFRALGLPPSTVVWATNKATPLSVGKALSRDFPTQAELFERGLPPGTFQTPNVPFLWGTFDLGSSGMRLFRKQQTTDDGAPSAAPSVVSEVLSSSGQPLATDTQQFMESRMGQDFSSVQIHTDSKAAQSAQSINALAYTSGQHIVFNEGQYQPHTDSGKRLLAHELVHVGQQGGHGIKRVAQQTLPEKSVCDAPQNESIQEVKGPESETDIPQNGATKAKSKEKTPAVAESSESTTDQSSQQVIKPQIVVNPAQDEAFKQVAGDTKRAKVSQNQHEKGESMVHEAELSAATPADKDTQEAKANQVLATEQKLTSAPAFSKEVFVANVKKLVQEGLPKNEKEDKQFNENGGVRTLTDNVKGQVVNPSDPSLEVLQQTSSASTASVAGAPLYQKQITPTQPEDPGRKAKIGQSERAVPKPVPQEAVQLDKAHNADSLDKAMEDEQLKEFNTQLSHQQLADSDEPEFQETLATKQEAQVKLCQIPAQNREAEYMAHQQEADQAQASLNKAMAGKFGTRKETFGQINEGKDKTRQNDEAILANYYQKIAGIYETSKTQVDEKLRALEEIPDIFSTAMNEANDTFKSRVKSRLEDYYGVGVFNLSEEDEDEWERATKEGLSGQIYWLNFRKTHTTDPVVIAQIDQKIRSLQGQSDAIETIPERVFREEKTTFINTLDEALDRIGTLLENTLNEARGIIQKGKEDIQCASQCVPVHLQNEAQERTTDFLAKFEDMEAALVEKQKEIEESLAREYTKNVAALKETFEKIRAEAAMPWWEKAWNAIKKVATIIYDLGKLLLKVLVKAVSVIGDIVAHPLRFIKNLFAAVKKGFSNFVDNIGTHLEKIVLRLVLGVLPPGVTLPDTFDAAGIFSLALDVLGLSKANIREKAVVKFGEPVVNALEETFDLFILFKKEGFAGLWGHIKERIGDLKEQVIEQVKTYLSEAIVKAAIKFLLSALTPVSGFIKACETIINMAVFFIENLKNILQLLDSILDSFIDVAQGKLENASLRIETALQDILLVGIKFLAALVGIKFDAISAKITKLFNAVRAPIDRAINWLLDKAKAFAEKTGLIALAKKGKTAVEKGKEELVKKGKAAGSQILGLFGVKSTFKDEKGHTHSVAYEEKGSHIQLTVRSTPKSIEEFITFYETEYAQNLKDATKKEHFDKIKTDLLPKMEQKVKDIEAPQNKNVQQDKEKLLAIKVEMAHSLGLLMKGNTKVGRSFESYYLEGMVGKYSKIANSRGDELEGDHQPQSALLVWAKKYLKKSTIENWIGSGHGGNAYAILLHKRRHKLGATHSTFTKPDETKIKAESELSKKRKLVVEILKKALKNDAKEMLKVYQKSDKDSATWGDVLHDTDGTDKEKKALIAKIKANVEAGEASIQEQPLDDLTQ